MDIGYILTKEKIKNLELVLNAQNKGTGIQSFIKNSSIEGVCAFLVVLAALLHFNANPLLITIAPFFAFFLPFLFNYIIAYYVFDSKMKEMEKHVPDVLLH